MNIELKENTKGMKSNTNAIKWRQLNLEQVRFEVASGVSLKPNSRLCTGLMLHFVSIKPHIKYLDAPLMSRTTRTPSCVPP